MSDDDSKKPLDAMFEKLGGPIGMLLINAAVTYGVVSTQIQWIRADLQRQEKQIDRMENRLFGTGKPAVDVTVIRKPAA